MTKTLCDACGKDITENHGGHHGTLEVTLRFITYGSHTVEATLCLKCGLPVMHVMGFGYDAGRLMSGSRGEGWLSEGDLVTERPNAPLVKIGGK